jgi:transcriptional regulator with XRE-family HTH domain
MEINERIKKLYELKKFKSQKEFSDTIGVSDRLVSNYFANKNTPSYDFLVKIVTTFKDVDARWLLTGERSDSENSIFFENISSENTSKLETENPQKSNELDNPATITQRLSVVEKEIAELKRRLGK